MDKNQSHYAGQMISVDIVVFSINDNELFYLTETRNKEPFVGLSSLIGGGVYNNESCEQAILREVKEKLNISLNKKPTLVGVFSDPKRDPRFRNISVAYYCFVPNSCDIKIQRNNLWVSAYKKINMAFDHSVIATAALGFLKKEIFSIDFMSNYLPKEFSLSKLQLMYESILNTKLDKRNFRRKLATLDCIEPTGNKDQSDTFKKSELYKIKKAAK